MFTSTTPFLLFFVSDVLFIIGVKATRAKTTHAKTTSTKIFHSSITLPRKKVNTFNSITGFFINNLT